MLCKTTKRQNSICGDKRTTGAVNALNERYNCRRHIARILGHIVPVAIEVSGESHTRIATERIPGENRVADKRHAVQQRHEEDKGLRGEPEAEAERTLRVCDFFKYIVSRQ